MCVVDEEISTCVLSTIYIQKCDIGPWYDNETTILHQNSHLTFNYSTGLTISQEQTFILSPSFSFELLCPAPTSIVNWHCSTHEAFVIFSHMKWPIQLILRQAAASNLAKQWSRQSGRRHSWGVGHVFSANHWHMNVEALLSLSHDQYGGSDTPFWSCQTDTLIHSNFLSYGITVGQEGQQ